MSEIAKLQLNDKSIDLPVVVGTENERGIDITKLRGETGYIPWMMVLRIPGRASQQ